MPSSTFSVCGRHGAEPGPDEAGRAGVVDPGVEVVAAEHDVEPGLLGRHCLLDQVFGLVGLVAAQPGELHLRLHQSDRVSPDPLTTRRDTATEPGTVTGWHYDGLAL